MSFDFQGMIVKNETVKATAKAERERISTDLNAKYIVKCIVDNINNQFECAERVFSEELCTEYEGDVSLRKIYNYLSDSGVITNCGIFIDNNDDYGDINPDFRDTIRDSVLSNINENYRRYVSYIDDKVDILFNICIEELNEDEINPKYDHIN